MIVVHLNEANFEYDIHSLVKAFYPGMDVSVFAGEKEIKESIDFTMEVEYQENKIIIKLDGKETGITVDLKNEQRSVVKDALKQGLYQVLVEKTGKELPWGNLTGIRPTKIPMKMLEEGTQEQEILSYMKEHYFCSEEKATLATEIAKRELQILEQIDYEEGYSLYVGIPFCPSTCLYCSFTSYPLAGWKSKVDLYLDALEKEITYTATKFANKKLNTIYIGGGTPTTLSAQQLDRLIRKIKCSFNLKYVQEFTVEAGRPDSITREKLQVLKRHGVTRISINPQTFSDETLKLIGRHHTVEQTVECFQMAREEGFDNINMDLIMGLPGEDLETVKHTMEMVRKYEPDDVTVHSLALKRASRLNIEWDSYKKYQMANTTEQMNHCEEVCKEMGLTPYYLYRQKNMAGNFENVGYAAPGKAGIYNILIMEEVQSIVALGAGTVTKRVFGDGRIERCDNVKDVTQYMERIDEMIARKQKLFFEK